MRQHTINFANFICTFGEGKNKKVLMDYIDTIVLPAFVDDSLVRNVRRSSYFFHQAKLQVFDKESKEPMVAITGKFVKNTFISREQRFDDAKGLISDEAIFESAPSAFFVLVLNTHRLIYFPETAYAPDFSAFKATALHNLKKSHKKFIQKLTKSDTNELTLKALKSIHPIPKLSLVPVSGEESLAGFMKRIDVLKRIEFQVLKTNDELDYSEMFDDVRTSTEEIGAETTKLVVSSKEGMDVQKAQKLILDATTTSNQSVKVVGENAEGGKIDGDNKDFSISVPVAPVPVGRQGIVNKMREVYNNLLNARAIKIGERPEASVNRITEFARQIPDD